MLNNRNRAGTAAEDTLMIPRPQRMGSSSELLTVAAVEDGKESGTGPARSVLDHFGENFYVDGERDARLGCGGAVVMLCGQGVFASDRRWSSRELAFARVRQQLDERSRATLEHPVLRGIV